MLAKEAKIYIAGHNGMVGSACWSIFEKSGYLNLIGKTSSELDLLNQKDTDDFIASTKPDLIIDAAAKVGGILANESEPFEFLMKNMLIQNNLINSSHNHNISKFIFLGSSCIYPKYAPQPLKEKYLLSGDLEPTNQWYAVAKISGVKLIESLRKQYSRDYISLMPTNLYGPNDNFDLNSSHVLPAMIRKFDHAKKNGVNKMELWGSGKPKREFLHVDDLAKCVLFAAEKNLKYPMYNVGTGVDISIEDLATKVSQIVGYSGKIVWNTSKPDGTPRKLLDTKKINEAGWNDEINLEEGIMRTYQWYKNHYS